MGGGLGAHPRLRVPHTGRSSKQDAHARTGRHQQCRGHRCEAPQPSHRPTGRWHVVAGGEDPYRDRCHGNRGDRDDGSAFTEGDAEQRTGNTNQYRRHGDGRTGRGGGRAERKRLYGIGRRLCAVALTFLALSFSGAVLLHKKQDDRRMLSWHYGDGNTP